MSIHQDNSFKRVTEQIWSRFPNRYRNIHIQAMNVLDLALAVITEEVMANVDLFQQISSGVWITWTAYGSDPSF